MSNAYRPGLNNCRTCLLLTDDISLYADSATQISVAQLLMNYTSLKYFDNDGLPTKICRNCNSEISRFHQFQTKCHLADRFLRFYLSITSTDNLHLQNRINLENNSTTEYNSDNENDRFLSYNKKYTFDNRNYFENEIDSSTEQNNETTKSVANSINIETQEHESAKKLKSRKMVVHNHGISMQNYITSQKNRSENNQITQLLSPDNDSSLSLPSVESNSDNENERYLPGYSFSSANIERNFEKFRFLESNYKLKNYLDKDAVTYSSNSSMEQNDKSLPNHTIIERQTDQVKELDLSKPDTQRNNAISMERRWLDMYNMLAPNTNLTMPNIVQNQSNVKETPSINSFKDDSLTIDELENFIKDKSLESNNWAGKQIQNDQTKKMYLTKPDIHPNNAISMEHIWQNRTSRTDREINSLLTNKQSSIVNNHLKNITKLNTFKCEKCENIFNTKTYLTIHMREHGENPYSCTVCNCTFAQEQSYTVHNMQEHNGGKPYSCTYCKCSFDRKHNYTIHLLKHNGKKPYTCISDNLTEHVNNVAFVQNQSNIEENSISGHSDVTLEYGSAECSLTLNEIEKLVENKRLKSNDMRNWLDVQRGPFILAGRPAEFSNIIVDNSNDNNIKNDQIKELNLTKSDIHPNNKISMENIWKTSKQYKKIKNVQTPQLEMPKISETNKQASNQFKIPETSKNTNLSAVRNIAPNQKHKSTNHIETKIKCEICDRQFNSKAYVKIHMRKHTGEKPYTCPTCGSSFIQNSNLKKHMLTHTGKRPYSCTQCDLSFLRKGHLTRHLRTHTGEKPYPCTLCDSAFKQQNNLTDHMRTHTGEKPYMCAFCGSAFSQNNTLTDHMRLHTGERPYSCIVCDCSFVRKQSYTIHMQKHTGGKPYLCTASDSSFKQKYK